MLSLSITDETGEFSDDNCVSGITRNKAPVIRIVNTRDSVVLPDLFS